jgi:hypothetical protein
MASDEAPARRCPSLDDILAHVHRRPSAPAPGPLLEHIDACVSCQALLAAALRHEASDEPSRRAAPGTLGRGDELIDRYRIERFVARGGMGEVYVAFDLLLEETVALKTLSCTSLDDERAAFRFKAEARLARRVTHPNVCRILEFGVHTIRTREGPLSIPFLTMEWLDGESVAQRIAANGPRPEDETFETALEVLEALGAIHAAGIVHRDLKSENVMLVPSAARRGRASSWTSGWLARSTAASCRRGPLSAPWPARSTRWRPSSCRAGHRRPPSTSSRSACCCSRCSRAGARSPACRPGAAWSSRRRRCPRCGRGSTGGGTGSSGAASRSIPRRASRAPARPRRA